MKRARVVLNGSAALGAGLLAATALRGAELVLQAPAAITNGANFQVALTVSNADDLAGFQTVLQFDRGPFELLAFETIGLGAGAPGASGIVWRLPPIEEANASGAVSVAAVRLAPRGVTGNGVLLRCSFRERAGGTYQSLFSASPTDTVLADSVPGALPATCRDAVVQIWGDGDADGLPDDWESANLRTLAFGPGDDPDGDGESCAAERLAGTDPLDARSAADATNRFDRFQFTLCRHALQETPGATNAVFAWSAEFVCCPRCAGQRFIEAFLAVPLPRGGQRLLTPAVPAEGTVAACQASFNEFSQLRHAFPGGDYAARFRVVDGVATQSLRLAFSVPNYEAEDFPPFVPVEFPLHGTNGISRMPLLRFGDTNWTSLAILNADRQRRYAAVGDGTDHHAVTQRLAAGRGYWLVAERRGTNDTPLASRTWSGFATRDDLPFLLVQDVPGAAVPAPGLHLFEPGSLVTNWTEASVQTGGTWHVAAGWRLTGHEPGAGTTNRFVFAITNNAVLDWLWQTNYWVEVLSTPHGTVAAASGWRPAGSETELLALPAVDYHWEAWLLDPGGTGTNNPLLLLVQAPVAVQPLFGPDLAPLGTPHWWLAARGTTNAGLTFAEAETANPDGDPHITVQEYQADTDPLDDQSYLTITGLRPMPGGFELAWRGGTAACQVVETAAVPGGLPEGWQVFFTNAPPTSLTNSLAAGGTTNRVRFFRIRAFRP